MYHLFNCTHAIIMIPIFEKHDFFTLHRTVWQVYRRFCFITLYYETPGLQI